MAKSQGIGSAAGDVSASDVGVGNGVNVTAPLNAGNAAEATGGGKLTAKGIAEQIVAAAKKTANAANAAEVKRLCGTLHRIHGSTSGELEKAYRAYYAKPTADNAKAVVDQIGKEDFGG